MIERYRALLLALVTLAPVACQPLSTPTPTDAIEELIAVLEAQGLSVELTDRTVRQPFLTPIGAILLVEGEDLQVFVYEDKATLEREAANIGPDGYQVTSTSGAPMIIDWVAQPHMYVRGRLLLIFISNNEALASKIAAVAGRVLVGEPPQAVQIARQVLAQQLRLGQPFADLASYERADWSDGCLEVHQPGQFCTEQIVPGYRVILEARGQRYEMHTDLKGNQVVLADAPEAVIEDPVLIWQSDLERVEVGPAGCRTVILDAEGNAAFGACVGARLKAPLLSEMERHQELIYFLDRYLQFQADTHVRRIEFFGHGTVQATSAEQRAIAEWAILAHQELLFGRSGASWGPALAFAPEGYAPCSGMQVQAYGRIYANDCSQGIRPIPPTWLNAEQLTQLYTWMDEFQGFELPFRNDGTHLRLVMSGFGRKVPDQAQKQSILEWAKELRSEIVGA